MLDQHDLLLSIPDYGEQKVIDVFLVVDPGVLVGVVDTNPAPHKVAVDNLTTNTTSIVTFRR